MSLDDELARLAKALGHPARIRILRMLLGRQECVCGEIVEGLPFAQSTVSQHLKVLREAGLVRGQVEGACVCYCIDGQGLARLKELVETLRPEGGAPARHLAAAETPEESR